MATLRSILLGAMLLMPAPALADPVERWSIHINEASRRFGVPEPWIRRVMRAESAGLTSVEGRPIVSRAGAMGLMQLMPGTWAELRERLRLGADPHNPRDNILAGAAYLRAMYDQFGYPGLFAAYNAGPGRYARHLAIGRPLPAETVNYVARVADPRVVARNREVTPPIPRLFAELSSASAGARADEPDRLFIPLSGSNRR